MGSLTAQFWPILRGLFLVPKSGADLGIQDLEGGRAKRRRMGKARHAQPKALAVELKSTEGADRLGLSIRQPRSVASLGPEP